MTGEQALGERGEGEATIHMDYYLLTMVICFLLFGAAVLLTFWMLSSDSRLSKRLLNTVERVNELLTFGKV